MRSVGELTYEVLLYASSQSAATALKYPTHVGKVFILLESAFPCDEQESD